MAKHAARQRWFVPLIWLVAAIILAGVLIGILFITLAESKSVSPSPLEGDPDGVVLRSIVRTVDENMPLGSRLLSHRYVEPRWHNCSPDVSAGYSDVEAHFVYYIPTSTETTAKLGGKPHGWTLDPSLAPYSWTASSPTFSVSDSQFPISADVSLSAKVISRSADIWDIDGSSVAFGKASSFCGGPG